MAEFPESQLLVYADEASRIKIDVRLDDGSVLLTRQAIAGSFHTAVQTIKPHIPILPNFFMSNSSTTSSIVSFLSSRRALSADKKD